MDASRGLSEEYSEKASAYEQRWSPVIQPMARPLLAALPLTTAGRILDVGAGTGAHLEDLKRASPHATVIGVDRAAGMLRVARRSGHGRLAVMDAQRLGVRAGSIDVVALIFVLFHLPEPPQGLREAHRVLRDGGTLGIVTWGRDPGSPGLAIWKEELDREGAAPEPRDPSVMQQAAMDTPRKIQDLLSGAGFESVRVWGADVAHQWTLDELLAVQTGCGAPARRLPSLSREQRARCTARVTARLARLTPADLAYRPEVLFAVAGRSDPQTAESRA